MLAACSATRRRRQPLRQFRPSLAGPEGPASCAGFQAIAESRLAHVRRKRPELRSTFADFRSASLRPNAALRSSRSAKRREHQTHLRAPAISSAPSRSRLLLTHASRSANSALELELPLRAQVLARQDNRAPEFLRLADPVCVLNARTILSFPRNATSYGLLQ